MNFKLRIVRHKRLLSCLIALFLVIAVVIASRPHSSTPVDSYAACAKAGYPILDTDPPICRQGSRNFTGTPLPKATAAPDITNLSYEILVNGDTHGDVPAHHQEFISSTAEWDAYWRRVHSSLASLPPLLPVDFSNNDVIGVSMGSKVTSGYGIKITGVTATIRGTVVSLTESTPTITCSVAVQASNRYVIVRTPKLLQPVSFRVTSEKRRC